MASPVPVTEANAAAWFEFQCLNELPRRPKEATRALEDFRETSLALPVAQTLLQRGLTLLCADRDRDSQRDSQRDRDRDNLFIVQFHALSVTHYTLLMQWEQIQSQQAGQSQCCLTTTWRLFLRDYLVALLGIPHCPAFLMNKAMQVFVSINKKHWLSASASQDDKVDFLNLFVHFLRTPQVVANEGATAILGKKVFGSNLMLLILEEMQKKTGNDLNLTYYDVVLVKRDFQNQFLPMFFQIAIEELSQQLAQLNMDEQYGTRISLILRLIKSVIEVISWDYTESVNKANEIQEVQITLLSQYMIFKPPRGYSSILTDSSFLQKLFEFYRMLISAKPAANSPTDLESCKMELSNLLYCLSGLNGEVFTTDAIRVQYFCRIISESVDLLEMFAKRKTLQLLTVEADDFSEGGSRSDCLQFICRLLANLFNNISFPTILSWSVVSPDSVAVVTNFIAAMMFFCENIVSEVTVLTSDIQVRLERSNFRDISTEINLIATWRMELLTLLLELLQMVISPSMTQSSLNHIELYSCYHLNGSHRMLADIVSRMNVGSTTLYDILCNVLGKHIFPILCESVVTIFVNDTLISKEDEEFEEEEDLAATSLHGLLGGCCNLGRLKVDVSLVFLNNAVKCALQDLSGLQSSLNVPHQRMANLDVKEIYCLERARLAVLFQSYLLADDFMMNGDENAPQLGETNVLQRVSSVSFNKQLSGETPSINIWLLHTFQNNPMSLPLVFQSIQCVGELLFFQNSILQAEQTRGKRSIEASPLLLQTIFRFFSAVVCRYMDPDPDNYMEETLEKYSFLKLNVLSGPEFYPAIELIFSSIVWLAGKMPLETGAIRAACETAIAVCRSKNPRRLEFISNLSAIQSLLAMLFNPTVPSQCHLGGGLSFDGFAAATETVSFYVHKANQFPILHQICTNILTEMQKVQQFQQNDEVAIKMKRQILACFTGLARSPETEDETLFRLFDSWWSWLSGRITTSDNRIVPSLNLFLCENDELLISYTYLLRDYSEHQLPRLSDSSAAFLYSAFAALLITYSERLTRGGGSSLSEEALDEELAFKSDSSLLLLDVLNHLSSKEFLFVDDAEADAPLIMSSSFQHDIVSQQSLSLQDVPKILLFGLQTMLPLIKTDILLSFPLTAERYFSFVVFLCGSHMDLLVQWINTNIHSLAMTNALIEQVVVGMTLTDATTARMAFQVLQLLATHQVRFMSLQNKDCTPLLHQHILTQPLPYMLRMALQPLSREIKLTLDRIDAFANALVCLIILDQNAFKQVVNEFIQLQTGTVQVVLLKHVNSLCTDRSVSMFSIDKKNRQLFVQNFREFINHARSLPLR